MVDFVPKDHPRYRSLMIREKIIEGMHQRIVAEAGLIAHGRGEAFDYLLGEQSPPVAQKQEKMAVIMLLLAEKPVISVNGNVAVLCPAEIVEFANIIGAKLEVNLFYRTPEREQAVLKALKEAGAKEVLGLDPNYQTEIAELSHKRRIVDKRGIYSSDCVFVPLEDGDRTMALRKLNKKVIAVDLNPLSRTSLWASVTVVNEITRAIKEMISIAKELSKVPKEKLAEHLSTFTNETLLKESIYFMSTRLKELATSKKLLYP